ncbi:MAG: polysaccharide biosynthesis tyrosine autokinase [Candidatus Acidiferrum sp.]
MADSDKLTHHNGSNGIVEIAPMSARLPGLTFSPREPHLYDYLLILRKHQWLIFSFTVAVVTIVAIATFRMQPVYVASARIEIDRENSNILPFQGTDSYDYMLDLENYIETQSKILTSETLALQTIRNAGLSGRPEFASPNGPSEAVSTGNLANQLPPPELGQFLAGLSVHRVPNSRLMDVTYESTDPRLAARIVNTHIDTYVERNFRSRFDASTKASSWLAGELDDLRIKMKRSEDARIAYERQNQIWALDDKQNVTTQGFADVNKQLTEAQSDRMKKESLFKFAKEGKQEAVPQLLHDPSIAELTKKRADLNAQYTDALSQYGPNFPKVVRLKAQLKDTDDSIEKQKQIVIESLESDYQEARQRETLLSQALDERKSDVNKMSEKMVEYNILKREADADKVLYDGLLNKLKEADISVGLRSSNIRIVDPAMVPTSPARPAKARNIMLAFLVGLVGGIGLALMREYLDNTVKTPDDVEILAHLPSLAVVPLFGDSASPAKGHKLLSGFASNGHEKRIELVTEHLPKSQMSEAFRALRTSLLLSQAEHPPQVILVTSSLPREGKTTAAANLAVTLAQLGDSTILVDADLRKPGVGRLLNLHGGKYAGLSSYLAGVSSLDLVTIPHPTVPNLAVIPTGPLPPNPADLLSSHKLADAVSELRSKFKFIVIDSPPVLAATDAVILSVQVDGVLLVVRSGETPKEAFSRTRDLLSSVKCNILGVVLNAVDSSAPDYYYSYRYYPYSYGYGPQEASDDHGSQVSAGGQENFAESFTRGDREDSNDDSQVL